MLPHQEPWQHPGPLKPPLSFTLKSQALCMKGKLPIQAAEGNPALQWPLLLHYGFFPNSTLRMGPWDFCS